MNWGISALAGALIIAGCVSTGSHKLRGSVDYPLEPKIVQTIAGQPPTTGPVPVTLAADGYFTTEGMRISFLRECAEATLNGGFDSFALFHYKMSEPRLHHYEAHGEIVERQQRVDDPNRNIFDARNVLADHAM